MRFKGIQFFSGYITLIAFSVILSLMIIVCGLIWSTTGILLTLILSIAPILTIAIVRFPNFGVIFYIISAYWIMFLLSIGVNFPLGTVMDALLGLLILGFLILQKKRQNWEMFKDPISFIILIWISYNLLQVLNPATESRLAWLYTIRTVAVVMLSYFIFCYHINTVKFIRLIIKIWLAMSMLAALYAIKQEYFGFFAFEQRSLDSNPLIQSLYFIDGHWRKSSIFSDPVAFSYNMVASTILCFVLGFGPTTPKQKIILVLLGCLFTTVMLYSGTRAAYVLLPVALILFIVLNFNKRVLFVSCAGGLMLLSLINFPTSNNTLLRFQSAFRPSKDASYNVREENQKKIQPYIKSHPFGGGLGATGVWGVRFAPYSFLAQFPPDSGFVRVAVELGWIGLVLICTLMYLVLKTGINNYFDINDPELKSYCLAMVLIVFAICIGNFPQEAIVQYPLNVYFCLAIALINVSLRLDRQKSEKLRLGSNGIDK